MTTQHVRQRRPLEVADRLCPICCSVPGTACRKVLSPPESRKLKLGARMLRIHPARRTTVSTAVQSAAPDQQTAEQQAAQRRAAQWEREKQLWEKDKRARGL